MIAIRFRPLARSDLDEIWDFTADRWGIEQADIYLARIRLMVERLADLAPLSSEVHHLYPGLRKAREGSHLIYFLADDHQLEVVRILHERQDTESLL
jgi:toxin ParE1/3/4